MSPIEEKVTALLAELAAARPVEVGTPPVAASVTGATGRADRPDYVPVEAATPRQRRRPVLVAAAAVLVLAVVGGLLVLGRGGGSPVVASLSDLPVDTSLLGDGRMAVVVENQLYVADGPTGQVWKLTATGRGEEVSNVSFSHDGEWVAFTIHDESGLWVSRWNGTERHRIGRAPSTYAWSPTVDQLAYTTQNQVRVARTDGSSRALPLTFSVPPQAFGRVSWSPDGTRLAFLDGEKRVTTVFLDDPSTGERNVVPVEGLVAWPRDDLQLVGVGSKASAPLNLAALPARGVPQGLADVALGSDGFTLDVGRDRFVGVSGTPQLVPTCRFDTLTCESVAVPFAGQGYTDPALSPDESRVALVGGLGGTELVGTTLVVADLDASRTWELGPVDSGPRGTIAIDGSGYGVGTEPPVWLDDTAILIRVDSSSVVRVDVATGRRSLVVAGNRFRPPADDYPGGTGLAYWSPR